jgi:hypothetical protein
MSGGEGVVTNDILELLSVLAQRISQLGQDSLWSKPSNLQGTNWKTTPLL